MIPTRWPPRRLAVLLLALGAPGALPGAVEEAPPATAAEPAAEETRIFEIFVEQLVTEELAASGAPGAVVAVVVEGRAVLVKGYGQADPKTRRPVDGETTVFHVGALAKPVTASVVLRLIDRGALGLDEDLRRRLARAGAEPTLREPLTATHLLAHTAGLDEPAIGRRARNARELLPLAGYLDRHPPIPVRPPGLISVYSDHGYALLGLLVEQAAERPFAAAMAGELFVPLGMARSTFGAPPPGAAPAIGHHADGAAAAPEWLHALPAGMLWTTGADMARWLEAVLGGAPGDRGWLSASGRRRLLERQFGNHPELPGRSLGLHEGGRFDPPELHHAGGASGISSALVLVPARGIGLFVALTAAVPPWSLTDRLLERLGVVEAAMAGPERIELDLAPFTGYYRSADLPRGSPASLASLVQQERLAAAGGGLDWRGVHYLPIGPLLFGRPGGVERLGFTRREGEVRYLTATGTVQERVPWHRARPFQLALWLLFALVFALGAAGWTETGVPRRLRRLTFAPAGQARWPALLVRCAAGIDLLFLAGLALLLARGLDGETLQYGLPPLLAVLLILPLPAAALAVAAALAGALLALRRGGSASHRWRLPAMIAALLAFLPFLASWGLLRVRW